MSEEISPGCQPQDCCGDPSMHTTAERRERWDAVAQQQRESGYAVDHRALPGFMTVADEEIRVAKLKGAQIVAANYVAENARLHSDLRESADALEESAQLLEDALNEGERLRTELREVKKVADRRESWLSSLRAELAEVRRNFHRERNDAANLHAAVSRLRAELERSQAEEVESRIRASEAEATISRVRSALDVIDSRDWTHPHSIMERLRSALYGESE